MLVTMRRVNSWLEHEDGRVMVHEDVEVPIPFDARRTAR